MVAATPNSLVPVVITSVGDCARAAWAEGLRVLLPSGVLDRTGWRRAIGAGGALSIPRGRTDITMEDVSCLRERCAFTERPPASARLPFSYQTIPGWARAAVASVIGRYNRRRTDVWAAFPQWPLDLSTDLLDDLRDHPDSAPPRGPTPVLLTHDIDSPEGLESLVERFLPVEDEAGARSTNYIVPCRWDCDEGRVASIVARGHEVGVHGFDHSNTTPFAAANDRARRLDRGRAFGARYHATGYRAPSLLRTRPLLRDLASRFEYDSSIPTAGGLFPTPNNGCATARPFAIEGIVELPVTMPRDGSLRFLGFAPDDILKVWIECADRIAQSRGVVVLLTHCERRFSGDPRMFRAYERFLAHVRAHSDRFTFSRPARVLAGAA